MRLWRPRALTRDLVALTTVLSAATHYNATMESRSFHIVYASYRLTLISGNGEISFSSSFRRRSVRRAHGMRRNCRSVEQSSSEKKPRSWLRPTRCPSWRRRRLWLRIAGERSSISILARSARRPAFRTSTSCCHGCTSRRFNARSAHPERRAHRLGARFSTGPDIGVHRWGSDVAMAPSSKPPSTRGCHEQSHGSSRLICVKG